MTSTDPHRYWLDLLDSDGPFLSVPALRKVWPSGMPALDRPALDALRDAKPAFEKAWDAWDLAAADRTSTDRETVRARRLEEYRAARDEWVSVILRTVVGWKNFYFTPGSVDVKVHSPNYSVTVAPTGSLTRGDTTGALVLVTDPVESLRVPLDDGWAASPIDRMEELLRKSKVRVGIVTDGRWWAVVSARPETMVASGITDSHRWIELPAVRDGFLQLLRLPRLVGKREEDLLTTIFGDSVAAAEEITETLGTNVRRAVELLVQALSESAQLARRNGNPDPLPADRDEVYQAAVTIMMRIVFLLFAEERGLLPQSELFTAGYGISDQLDVLDQRLRDEGAEALDRSSLTWHRLLATSQALYQGASFEDFRIPAYGGSLFNAARFPFLARVDGHEALAVSVSDLVMLEVLRAAQMAELRGEPARRVSFRDIDVEQIGYIYEGLLGYSCTDVQEVTVGLIGKRGEEPEIPLSLLEGFAATHAKPDGLASAIINWARTDQPASVAPSKAALAKALKAADEAEDADRALRSVAPGDQGRELRERLRPFLGAIRRDLRDRPTVFNPGGLILIETPSRATAGAHYTPKSLATEVVQHALEPLVYDPGPHQQADGWKLVRPERILSLKVADIACGSGAFLVAAARFLADRLVEAWTERKRTGGKTPAELKLHAIREVIAHCLYGADINGMAIEMCKLSLWLVSLDPKLPFSFVDDKILHGNSLLGLTDVDQLKWQHIYPSDARPTLQAVDVDGTLREAAEIRRSLASEADNADPMRSVSAKVSQLEEFRAVTRDLTDIADAIVATGLKFGGKPGRALNNAYKELEEALGKAYPNEDLFADEPNRDALEKILEEGLTPTVPTDYERWKPLHWPIAVPDVFHRGGFDAIIGNPPFVTGSDITGAMGVNVRDWLVNVIAGGKRGNADLVAYFFLRALRLVQEQGKLGLIATNSIAQGKSREVGLDQMIDDGFVIYRSVQSRPWTSSAALEYSAVWGTCGEINPEIPRVADGVNAHRITSLLEPAGRVEGNPARLYVNSSIAFKGCEPSGKGFVISPEVALDWIRKFPENGKVVRPYLTGGDIAARPDQSVSRWIIDFTGLEEFEAMKYKLPYEHAKRFVLPQREAGAMALREAPWWLFERTRPGMRAAIKGLREVLAMIRHSVSVMPVRVSTGSLFGDSLAIFAVDSYAIQAILSSSVHQAWAIRYGSSLETRVRYTPSGIFETFPRPVSSDVLAEVGRTLDTERREIMMRRDLGLTKLYNLVNDPNYSDDDIEHMRRIHVDLDAAVMDAYGWNDVELNHGFHTYRQVERWTVCPEARVEILDRLLKLNLERAAAQGDAPPPAEDEDEGDGE